MKREILNTVNTMIKRQKDKQWSTGHYTDN
jgi:hypothetical protein